MHVFLWNRFDDVASYSTFTAYFWEKGPCGKKIFLDQRVRPSSYNHPSIQVEINDSMLNRNPIKSASKNTIMSASVF